MFVPSNRPIRAGPQPELDPHPVREQQGAMMKAILTALAALALAIQLIACGGGSSSSPSSGGAPTPAAAKGIATPATVSVVSAK